MLKGSIVALVTPMLADGSLDKKALHELVDWHLTEKTDGIVIIGTTGEAPTLNAKEQQEITELVVKQVAKRIPVIVGTGTYATASTIENTLAAKAAGADACLIVTPYYNKPTQKGLYEHYKAITEKTGMPVILYNVPGRTCCDILPETAESISKLPGILGIKECSGKLDRIQELKKRCGSQFAIYSGDDDAAAEMILLGADGVISVVANVAPRAMHDLTQAALAGKRELTQELNARLALLHKKLFIEANPIPVKWALNTLGKIQSGIRLPLLNLDKQFHTEVREALEKANLLQPVHI